MKRFRWPRERHSTEIVEVVAEMYGRGRSRGQIALRLGKTTGQIAHIIRHHGMERGEADPARCAAITRQLTLARLTQCYGSARAERIMAGQDPATNADLAAWNNLGQARAA